MSGQGRVRTLLYCIGAQKSATTWVHAMPDAHPKCHLAPTKEVRFWDAARLTEGSPYAPRYAARWIARTRGERRAALRRLSPRGLMRAQRNMADARAYAALIDGLKVDDYARFVMRGYAGQPVVGELSPNYALLQPAAFGEMAALHDKARFRFVMRDPVTPSWSG